MPQGIKRRFADGYTRWQRSKLTGSGAGLRE
jgi:hypothetical protein